VVRPSAAKTPHREAERARRGAINRPPAQIPRAKPKKITATIQNGVFFSSLLVNIFGFYSQMRLLSKGCRLNLDCERSSASMSGMETDFTGSWRSVRSDIPGYVPEGEWLRFSEGGVHVWEIARPEGKGCPSVTHFVLKKEAGGWRLCPIIRQSGAIAEGWGVTIERTGEKELAVTPQHGFTTIFRDESD
jgi:hypothetical protein